jgi:hypothetical protein
MGDKLKVREKVQFHARTIVAEVQNGVLRMGVTDFSSTPIIAARPRTSVEFEAGTSREEAMAALTALLEAIEVNGLPETSCSINREDAKRFEAMLKDLAALKREYDRMSSKGQQRWRDYWASKNQGKDTNLAPFSEQRFRLCKWAVIGKYFSGMPVPTKR